MQPSPRPFPLPSYMEEMSWETFHSLRINVAGDSLPIVLPSQGYDRHSVWKVYRTLIYWVGSMLPWAAEQTSKQLSFGI